MADDSLTTITLAGAYTKAANGSHSPAAPTNNVQSSDLGVPTGYDNNFNYTPPNFHWQVLVGVLVPLAVLLVVWAWAAKHVNAKFQRAKHRHKQIRDGNDHHSRVPAPAPPSTQDMTHDSTPWATYQQ